MPFLIIFILIPLLEIAAFLHIGGEIGVWPTVLIALLTAMLGGMIIKYQGFITTQGIREAIARGETPLPELFDGLCLVAAGALLITPGFVTDTIGFLLLVPPVRAFIRKQVGKRVTGQTNIHTQSHTYQQQDSGIIEGDYERVDDNEKS